MNPDSVLMLGAWVALALSASLLLVGTWLAFFAKANQVGRDSLARRQRARICGTTLLLIAIGGMVSQVPVVAQMTPGTRLAALAAALPFFLGGLAYASLGIMRGPSKKH